MTTKLDTSLREALKAGTPVEVVDSETHCVYYLVSAEQFRQLAGPSNDFDPREFYPIIEKVMAADDAKDPLLDSYQ